MMSDAERRNTMEALLVTGRTYPVRRQLRALGGVWQEKWTGYAVPLDKLEAVKAIEGVDAEPFDFDGDPFRPLSSDDLRDYRQARKDRYADRLRDQAAAADRRAEKASGRITRGEREFLALAEPIKVGHHSERRHRNLLERNRRALEAEFTERKKADQLRAKADYMQPAAVKGDARRRRDKENEAARQVLEVGDTVNDIIMGVGQIVKANEKTFRVKYERGPTYNTVPRDLTLVAKGTGRVVKPEPKFKKGDQVLVMHSAFKDRVKGKGEVLRRTPNGYKVRYVWTFGDRSYTNEEVFRESQLKSILLTAAIGIIGGAI